MIEKPLAVTRAKAMKLLSISRTQLWRLTATGKIRVTSYGTIPVSELERHLQKEAR